MYVELLQKYSTILFKFLTHGYIKVLEFISILDSISDMQLAFTFIKVWYLYTYIHKYSKNWETNQCS